MRLSYTVATPEVGALATGLTGWSTDALTRLAAIGYRGVELQTRDPRAFDNARLAADVRRAGLVATGISTGPVSADDGLYLTSTDPENRSAAVNRLIRATELAAECETHVTIGGIRGRLGWSPDPAASREWLVAGVEAALERAGRLGVTVMIEPQNRHVTDVFNRVQHVVDFVTELGTDGLALVADSYHLALEERSVPAALVVAHRSGLLGHVQVSDTNRLAPGWGHLNWPDFFGTLQALDYSGWICVEAVQDPDTDSVARQGYTWARAHLEAPC